MKKKSDKLNVWFGAICIMFYVRKQSSTILDKWRPKHLVGASDVFIAKCIIMKYVTPSHAIGPQINFWVSINNTLSESLIYLVFCMITKIPRNFTKMTLDFDQVSKKVSADW